MARVAVTGSSGELGRVVVDHSQRVGVRNIVWASSETVLGLPFDEDPPGIPVKRPAGPNETLLSIDKARRVLGYEPEFSWRRVASRG